jgi:hypothetical protein
MLGNLYKSKEILYRDINNVFIFRGNCVNIINKASIFISKIYKDIIYLILFINITGSLKAKGKGLQIA